MKNKINLEFSYLETLVSSDFMTTYHYKIMLMLIMGAYTQMQIASKLDVKVQNVHCCIKELEERNYITVERIEGRNKYYTAVTSAKKLITESDEQVKGQLKF